MDGERGGANDIEAAILSDLSLVEAEPRRQSVLSTFFRNVFSKSLKVLEIYDRSDGFCFLGGKR